MPCPAVLCSRHLSIHVTPSQGQREITQLLWQAGHEAGSCLFWAESRKEGSECNRFPCWSTNNNNKKDGVAVGCSTSVCVEKRSCGFVIHLALAETDWYVLARKEVYHWNTYKIIICTSSPVILQVLMLNINIFWWVSAASMFFISL